MAELTRDETRYYHLSDIEEYPVAAGVTIYEGAAVGADGFGYARPLVAGDPFLGFAGKRASNVAGSNGDMYVQTKTNGLVKLQVVGIPVGINTIVDVYAIDDGTFTVNGLGNSLIGKIHKIDNYGYALVRIKVASELPEIQPKRKLSIKKTNGIAVKEFPNGTSDLVSTTPGTGCTITSTPGGGITMKQDTGTNVSSYFTCNCTPFLLESNTTVNIVADIYRPNGITSFRTIVSTQASNFAGALLGYLNAPISSSVPTPGGIALFTVTGAVLDTTVQGNGDVRIGTVIDRIRIAANMTQGAEIRIRKVVINPIVKTAIALTFDGNFDTQYTEIFPYLSKKGLTGSIALVSGSVDRGSGYMTQAQLDEVYDAGWDFANHSVSHRFANTGYGVGGESTGPMNQIAQAQTVGTGASFALNGTIGTAVFNAPRQLIFLHSGADVNKRFAVTGVDNGGNATTETVLGLSSSSYLAGQTIWTRVDSIVAVDGTAANVSVGVTLSYDELYADIKPCDDYLRSHGYMRARHIYVTPGGQTNKLLEQVLADLDIRFIRSTQPVIDQPYLVPHPLGIPSYGNGISSGGSATIIGYLNKAINQWSSFTFYLHEIVPDSATPISTDCRLSDFRLFIDAVATARNAGSIIDVTMSEYTDMCGY